MSWSNAVEAALLNQLTTASTFGTLTLSGNIFVALSTADPGEAGAGIAEVSTSSTGYARQQVTFGSVSQAADQATRANTGAMSHGPATAGWGLITHFALFDAVTGGDFLGSAALDVSRTVLSGDTFDWAIGALVIGNT